MSGIEVAGLVLGAVPLLISALEHYGEGVGTIERWWKYRRELAAIRRLLLAEQSVFQGTIERLLNGIVLDPELEDLLENSGRGSWSRQDFGDLDKKLNRRLGRSYASFEECVENINHVVAKLREDLELSENGKPDWVEGAPFVKQLKRIQFTLSRSSYMDSLHTIEKNNNILTTLLTQNLELEPLRKRRSGPSAFYNKTDSTARGICEAIESCWSCGCVSGHAVRIALDSRLNCDPSMVSFKLVFDMHKRPNTQSQAIVAHEAFFDSGVTDTSSLLSTTPLSQLSVGTSASNEKPKTRDRMKGWLHRKKDSTSTTSVNSQKSSSGHVKFAASSPPPASPSDPLLKDKKGWAEDTGTEITDLCAAISGQHIVPADSAKPIGYVSNRNVNASSRFILHWSSTLSKTAARMHLETLLSPGATRKTSRGERYSFALTIASSVLQLGNTDFITHLWTKRDIILYSDGAGNPPTASHNRSSTSLASSSELYIERTLPRPPNASADAPTFPGLRNQTIFRLGTILIELCLGQTLESLRSAQDPLDANGRMNILTEWSTATRLINDVAMEAGHRYGDAVRRCVFCDFDQRSSSLDNGEFRQALYNGVVAPLEDVWRDFSGG